MSRVVLEILGVSRPQQLQEVEALVGRYCLYRKGTDSGQFLNCDRARADLLMVNLNLIPGVKARILGDPIPPSGSLPPAP